MNNNEKLETLKDMLDEIQEAKTEETQKATRIEVMLKSIEDKIGVSDIEEINTELKKMRSQELKNNKEINSKYDILIKKWEKINE